MMDPMMIMVMGCRDDCYVVMVVDICMDDVYVFVAGIFVWTLF